MSAAEGEVEWARRRSEFNHDWLQNHYLLLLGEFNSFLSDPYPDESCLQEFLTNHFQEWEEKDQDATWLIESFETEMSPRTLFRYPPLSNCEPEDRLWLGAIVHTLWLRRYPVAQWVHNATEAYDKACTAYGELKNELGKAKEPDLHLLVSLRSRFVTFRELCKALLAAVGAFRGEVLVV